MGNTFSRCWRAVCVPSSFTEDGSAEWTESVEWTNVCDPAWYAPDTEMSEDRSAPKEVVGEQEKFFPARGHDEQDLELEDVLPEDIQIDFLPCELEDKAHDHSKTNHVDKPSFSQTSDLVEKEKLFPARGHDEQDLALEDVWPEDVQIDCLPCELENKAHDHSKTNHVDKPSFSQTSDVEVSTPRQTSEADIPKLGVSPGQPATADLSDDKQTRDNLKAQEKQSLLTDDDYSHLPEVQQHLVQEIEAALQEEMQRVFPQETITSLLPELRRTILREIQPTFLQQIEYGALLDRQEEELVALDKQLEREKLNHDIMFVLSQDCSKPPGIKEGQAERFGNRSRRGRKRPKAAVGGRKHVTMTGIG